MELLGSFQSNTAPARTPRAVTPWQYLGVPKKETPHLSGLRASAPAPSQHSRGSPGGAPGLLAMTSALNTIEQSHLWPWVTNTCRAIGRLSGCVSAIWTSYKHQALRFHPTLLEACKLKEAHLKWTVAFSDGNCSPFVGMVGVSARLDLMISMAFSNLNDSVDITLFSWLFF